MRQLNTVMLKLAKRAETYDRKHLIESFVDVGSLFTLLSNPDNQIIFGRRGTGKTHVLGYLASEIQKKGRVAVQLDMRTVGSTGGIYSDSRLTLAERATRLLVDTLCAIHDSVLGDAVQFAEEYNLSALGPLLDRLIEASTQVFVDGKVESEEKDSSSTGDASTRTFSAGGSLTSVSASAKISREHRDTAASDRRVKREGIERLRVNFGSVGRELSELVRALPGSQLWIILDEWSELPLDLQPYLADLLRRTLFPVRGISVKIAAIEQRCRFRIPDPAVGNIGIEIGADAAASINLDEFLVFDNDSDLAKQFFQDLLYRHVRAIVALTHEIPLPDTAGEFINDLFTQHPAFEEFVRSSEGVPRDGINIIGIAAQKASDSTISVPDIRVAAHTWYTRAKQQAVTTREEAQTLLNWIVDEVIKHRQARAFLLGTEVKDELIEFLYDARVLHVIRQGVSGGDVPGRRFNVYSLDYGCYVDLINTTRAPKGLFEATVEDKSGFVQVPQTDFRSIRRAILDLNMFYSRLDDPAPVSNAGTTGAVAP